eukprot:CAMPEP_0177226450 /NCGR_PEP_ID=MMETSP0367-20130122/40092_1 /TAXON_ID=447022 ORGANISM="Scrippsiella hangoei-like, Strain SHHI-4" /NCGR_SAMPLE_ID=MMETSP0367 /ASSEMBLY_ACC=CAM_ASM_000362 /LENGTH=95 /DNA_ID=CAMNT_0018676623 /DNA_START=11 /DNA_END=298 /DNA_ORIENTATION=+
MTQELGLSTIFDKPRTQRLTLAMGAALSMVASPDVQKKLEMKVEIASFRASQAWNAWGHTLYHYSIVPAVFGIGLAYSGEFTLNPATLISKILLQ